MLRRAKTIGMAVVAIAIGFATNSTVDKNHRSIKWRKVRSVHVFSEPKCAWCSTTNFLQVHHIIPFHMNASLELNPSNLVTLCVSPGTNCHLRVGHFCNFRKGYNVDARVDCSIHATNSHYLPPEFVGSVRSENFERVGATLVKPIE